MKNQELIIILAPVVSGYRENYLRKKGKSIQPFLDAPYKLFESLDISLPVSTTKDMIHNHILTNQNYDLFENYFSLIYEKNKIPIIFGGDHSISIPATTALAKHYKNIQTIRFDRDLDHGIAGSFKKDSLKETCKRNNFDEAGMGYLLHNIKNLKITHIGSPISKDYQGSLLFDNQEDEIAHAIKNLEHKIQFITHQDLPSNNNYETPKTPPITAPTHLSIDIDCYKGVNAKKYGYTPINDCMTKEDMGMLLPKIIRSGKIKSIDLSELTTQEDHRALDYARYTFDLLYSY